MLSKYPNPYLIFFLLSKGALDLMSTQWPVGYACKIQKLERGFRNIQPGGNIGMGGRKEPKP
jgi:hypothetical protein